VLNFEVAVGAARTMLLRAEREHEAARIALATLMALPEAMLPPEVQVAPLPDETPDLMRAPDADELVARALDQRPDLRQSAYAVQRSEAAVRGRYAEFSPQVGAFVRHEAQRFNGTDIRSEDFSTAAGVNVQYDIFTGGRRLARVREAKHARRESELRLRETELTVTSEVRQALLDVRTAQQQLVLQRTTLESVRRNRDLVARSYEAGKETLVRLNMAQRDLVRAESQLALARVELQRAWFDLRSVTGATVVWAGELAGDNLDENE
jgi:outer membrane protein TolC